MHSVSSTVATTTSLQIQTCRVPCVRSVEQRLREMQNTEQCSALTAQNPLTVWYMYCSNALASNPSTDLITGTNPKGIDMAILAVRENSARLVSPSKFHASIVLPAHCQQLGSVGAVTMVQ